MFLQILVEVCAELRAEDPDHLVPVHLAEGGAIHGAVDQAQGACIELGALYVVAEPIQNMFFCPAVRADLPVQLTCKGRNYLTWLVCSWNDPSVH